ncbi:MAG: GatB/YqeY domain-containing protein [Chloroflexi bacterium]|nr:GatB/YqeY domain-containing protein [Chloroflexota bacterium]
MTVQEQIDNDLKLAMKSGDDAAKRALRDVKTAVTRAQKNKDNQPLNDEETLTVIRKQAKQRQDSIDAYALAGRQDLVAAERAELNVLERYLPAQMDEAMIREQAQALIERTGAVDIRDMGKVMGPLMADLKGQADGRLVNRVVRELLSAPRTNS